MISRVSDAVTYLGIRRTVSLILASSVQRMVHTAQAGLPVEMADWFRVRNVLMASVAASFGKRLHRVSAETAHMLALLQDLGMLVCAHELGDRYGELLWRHRTAADQRLAAGEQQGLDDAQRRRRHVRLRPRLRRAQGGGVGPARVRFTHDPPSDE